MKRDLQDLILKDMKKKVILISGPRQSGKTTLAGMLGPVAEYLNYDEATHRKIIAEKSWDRKKPLIIFDELHKMSGWKTFLKGIFDVEGIPPAVVVTGSARLEAFRKVGDSLAGRFFSYRLHPLDIREVGGELEPDEAMRRILQVGGFPEPFFENEPVFYKRWQRTHLDVILRQDLIDLTAVTDIQAIESLIEMLRYRVGSPVSYASLARDLRRDPKTVKSWLILLEDLYVIFPVRPYHRNVARAILKEPKYYFYDTAQLKTDDGGKIENMVACSLLKYAHYIEDTRGERIEVRYTRTKEGREIDFIITLDGDVIAAYEVKKRETDRSPSFEQLSSATKDARRVQLVAYPDREKTYRDGVEIRAVAPYLADLSTTLAI